eukprot:TRINITY_DN3252_c0_g1_i1.p1 TRINITY_DN3252_c0_g1~~TRINITY_DN3252_c0_g1_i1.p1  ORF type:complete len:256 (-),score=65.95 TRINITY_DN3252_c0_g1_i1:19-786(-)
MYRRGARIVLGSTTRRSATSYTSCYGVGNSRSFYSTEGKQPKKKVAVVLSGCGVYDGSEIHEATSMLIHLSRMKTETTCFAPDISQKTINHVTSSEEGERNALVESARIARGKVSNIKELKAENFDIVLFPGGFGAAKTLCTFAKDGAKMEVDPEVQRVVNDFHNNKKIIGMCCIAPVIAAKLIPGVHVTIGNANKDVAKAIAEMGGKTVDKNVTEILVDSTHRVVTTPAYMEADAPVHKVFEGIGKLVDKTVSL